MGRTACASRGPKSRAGLIAYPVGPPRLSPSTHTRTPQNHGLNPGARPAGAKALLPKLKPTTIKKMVAMVSHNRFAGKFRMAGRVQNMDSFASGSGVSFQWGRYTSQTRIAPTNAPRTCALQNTPTFDQFFERIATAKVIAGLMCAPGLPQATAVHMPATTARPQAVAITIQPEFSPLDFLSRTFATTPSPSRIKTSVPMNSPRNGPCITPPVTKFSHQRDVLLGPIKASRDCLFPEVIQAISCLRVHFRLPTAIRHPVGGKFIGILKEPNCQPGSIGGA